MMHCWSKLNILTLITDELSNHLQLDLFFNNKSWHINSYNIYKNYWTSLLGEITGYRKMFPCHDIIKSWNKRNSSRVCASFISVTNTWEQHDSMAWCHHSRLAPYVTVNQPGSVFALHIISFLFIMGDPFAKSVRAVKLRWCIDVMDIF